MALFVLPNSMTDEGPLSLPETLEVGRQLFFGIGAIGLSIGMIIILQDAFIEDRVVGIAELVLSKPLSRTAYVLGRLVPNLLGFLITMLVVPGIIGYLLFLAADPGLVLGDYLSGLLIVAVQVIVQFTPWKFSDLAIMSASGLPLPEVGVTMLVSTLVWIAVFMAVAVIRMNSAEL